MTVSLASGPSAPGLGRLALYLAAFVGAALALNAWIFSGGAVAWARTLTNPPWSPPGPVIGAVWVALFGLMAGSAYVLDRAPARPAARVARVALLAELTVCLGWTVAYFGLQNVANGFYVTVVALVVGAVAVALAGRASRTAAALLLPLMAWLTFALVLSFVTWRLNPV